MALFNLSTSRFTYKKEEALKLKKLGLKFEDINDNCVKQKGSAEIEINSLDELLSLVKEYGDIIIGLVNDKPDIEIYDDYRE
jgi:hypothetical protein